MQLNESSLREKINSLKEKLVALEGLVDGSGNPVVDGSGNPIQTGADAAAPSGPNAAGVATGADMDAATAAEPVAAAPAPAAPAQPNFDTMPFGKAFAAARAAGLKQFNWKGKPYTTQMAPAKPVQTAAPTGATTPAPVMARPTNPMQANIWDRDYAKTHNPNGTPKTVKENASVGYAEDQTLARIVQLAR